MATPSSRANLAPFRWRMDGVKIAVDAGDTVPTDAAAGYDPGCIFVHTDSTSVAASGIYVNVGSVTSCNFDPVELLVGDGANQSLTVGTTVPSGAGYVQGAIHIDTNASVAASSLFMNYGTTATANYDVAQFVANPGNDAAGILVAGGTTVPADATAGYAVNCLFVNQSGASSVDRLYVNVGTAASCNFDATTLSV